MNKLTTEISHDELIHAWAPLVDVSRQLDRILEHIGGDAGATIGFMDDKVKCALEPLEACINRIEEENPLAFGRLDS